VSESSAVDGLKGIDKLNALAEIALLKARRDRAADTKDWDLYLSLHAPDHMSENGDYGRWTSAAEMIVNVRKSMENLVTMHHSHTPEITFETPSRAKGIWAMTGLSLWKQGDEDHWFRAFGHYFETYEKRDGHWVFTSRAVKYYHTMQSPGAIFPPRIDD
jgi:hypothetical protein